MPKPFQGEHPEVVSSEEVGTSSDLDGNASDNTVLKNLRYKPVLHRSFNQFHNFATTFAALYFVGGVRVTFSTGIAAGGNLAYWTSYIVTCVFTFITAAVIAETCSSLPLAESIYLWAAEAGARLFLTPQNFSKPAWSLGRLSKPFQVMAVFWNGWVVAVLYSLYVFPVSGKTLNYAPVIMASTTILALLSWWFVPAERWLPSQRIQQTLDADIHSRRRTEIQVEL